MQQRLQDNFVLSQLIASFEAQQEGLSTFFEDKELLQIIEYYEEEYEYEKALEVSQIGLSQYTFNSDFYISKARLLAIMEEYDGVIETIDEGLSIAPNELELKLLGIHAKTEMGNLDEAKSEIKLLLAEANADDRVDLLICKAHIHEKEKDFEAMFNALKKALIIDSNEYKALEKIWIAVELCKNYKESILLHQYVIDRNPYNHQAWYNLGHAYACLGEYPESIMSLEYSFLIDATFEIGYKDCAEMCFQVGRFRQALSIHLDALKQFGADMELLVSIGRCYLELNIPVEAKRYLAQATKIDPYDDEAHYYLGQSHFQTAEFKKAIACFAEAIKLEDRREEYYADLAKSYHITGDYTLANYYFNKATETGPEEMKYWFHHILFLLDIEAVDAAADVLEEAEVQTYGSEVLYIKSAIAFFRNERDAGVKLLTEAIEEDLSCLPSFYALYPLYQEDEEIKSLIAYFMKG